MQGFHYLLGIRYAERTVHFIEEHRERPFFIYLPHAMPGSTAATFSSETFRGKSGNGPWGVTRRALGLIPGRRSTRPAKARS